MKGEPVVDKTFSSEHEFQDRQTAADQFIRSRKKLFHVDKWSGIPGLTSTFELYDERGKRAAGGEVKENHFIRIVMPGIASENWVRVTQTVNRNDTALFVASPSEDPTEDHGGRIEHFFAREATSTFKVELEGKRIRAWEIGKNEGANVGEEAGGRDVLNLLISSGGWAGFQKLQWKNLTDYLVHLKE